MIIAPSQSFYVLRAHGEAAEVITSIFSPGVTGDILDILVVSDEFENDIEPMAELNTTIETIKCGLTSTDIVEKSEFNPLFIPMDIDALDDALEVEQKTDSVRFGAMGGNPFMLKLTEVTSIDETLIEASVAYHQFDLPGYEVIMESQQRNHLN